MGTANKHSQSRHFLLFARHCESLPAVWGSQQVNLARRVLAADFGGVASKFAENTWNLRPIGGFYSHNASLFAIIMN